MFLLDFKTIDEHSSQGQLALEAAHNSGERPLCLCTKPNPEMYVAKINEKYCVKRMPMTGAKHAPECEAFQPPEELSGLSQILNTAIDESETGEDTNIKLEFALTMRGGRTGPPPGEGLKPVEAKAVEKKLTITSFLQYLFHESDLVKWYPKMKGKRSWYIVHKCLTEAALRKTSKKIDLASRLYIPEPYYIDKKDEISARRRKAFHSITNEAKSGTPLGILMAEYKSHAPSQFGYKFTFKHIPDCPFFAGEELGKAFNQIFEEKFYMAQSLMGSKIMVISTFSLSKSGYPIMNEVGVQIVTETWIPYETEREFHLIEKAQASDRSFIKSLRFNLRSTTPIASMVFTDRTPPVAAFVTPEHAEEKTIDDMREVAENGAYPFWLWEDEDIMPDLSILS